MPELPEVEHLRRTLLPTLLGAKLLQPRLARLDVLRVGGKRLSLRSKINSRTLQRYLLGGSTITQLIRHGKNLVLVSDTGHVLCVHLGMSGQMQLLSSSANLASRDHVHCVWRVMSNRSHESCDRLIFRDPRRFGGLWAYESLEALHADRLSALGPDALTITAAHLHRALQNSRRPVKAALLDQTVLAGVGNIYADEALFRAAIHPSSLAQDLSRQDITRLAKAIRAVLRQSIDAGGSTIRDYIDGSGTAGRFGKRHMVYGKAGKPCPRCSHPLSGMILGQRSTVACPSCQPRIPPAE